MTQAERADQPGQEEAVIWQRLSPRSLAVRPVLDLIRFLPLLLGLLYLHANGGGSGDYWGLVLAGFAVVTSIVRWFTTHYRITADRVYVRRGLLSQKVLSVARDRVRTVDLSAHMLYRLLGLRKVAIGTGRNDRREGESFRLDALTLADAEALRAMLLAGRPLPANAAPASAAPASAATPAGPALLPGGAALASAGESVAGQAGAAASAVAGSADPARPAGPAGLAGAETEIARLHPAWIRFAPLTLTGLVIIGVLFGFIMQFSDEAHINLASSRPVHKISVTFTALSAGPRIVSAVLAIALCLVVISAAGYVAVFWNFRLLRQGEGTLRITRGLLSTRATTIDASRLRGVEISEPLLLRAARGARCIAITTGLRVGRGAERGGSLLLPPAPRRFARIVAAEVLGGPAEIIAGPLIQHGPRARRRRYLRALTAAVLVIAVTAQVCRAAHWPALIWLSSLALLPLAAALAADRYRGLGHLQVPGWLVTCTGSLVRRRSMLATEGIIGWRIHQSWFQRRQGLVTLTATTAAGRQHYAARDIPAALALSVAAAATPALTRPFLVPPG